MVLYNSFIKLAVPTNWFSTKYAKKYNYIYNHLLDGARETLVLLGIIVLQRNLQFHRLGELPLLLIGVREQGVDRLKQSVPRHLATAEQTTSNVWLSFVMRPNAN